MYPLVELVPGLQAQTGDFDWIAFLSLIISFFALGFTLWSYYVRLPRISVHPGVFVGIVHTLRDQRPKIHIMCSLINSGMGTGVVKWLDATITGPNGSAQFDWRIFWDYKPDGSREQLSRIYPVLVSPSEGELKFIEFAGTVPSDGFAWTEGIYEVQLGAKLNRTLFNKEPRENCKFQFEIPADLAAELMEAQEPKKGERWGVTPVSIINNV